MIQSTVEENMNRFKTLQNAHGYEANGMTLMSQLFPAKNLHYQ